MYVYCLNAERVYHIPTVSLSPSIRILFMYTYLYLSVSLTQWSRSVKQLVHTHKRTSTRYYYLFCFNEINASGATVGVTTEKRVAVAADPGD